jgi:hypothetical protein
MKAAGGHGKKPGYIGLALVPLGAPPKPNPGRLKRPIQVVGVDGTEVRGMVIVTGVGEPLRPMIVLCSEDHDGMKLSKFSGPGTFGFAENPE